MHGQHAATHHLHLDKLLSLPSHCSGQAHWAAIGVDLRQYCSKWLMASIRYWNVISILCLSCCFSHNYIRLTRGSEKLLYPRRSRMMSPPSLQIYLQSRVTLTFKLLTTKLTVSCPCHIDHLCQLTSKSVHLFSKYRTYVDMFGQRNERMDERTDNVRT